MSKRILSSTMSSKERIATVRNATFHEAACLLDEQSEMSGAEKQLLRERLSELRDAERQTQRDLFSSRPIRKRPVRRQTSFRSLSDGSQFAHRRFETGSFHLATNYWWRIETVEAAIVAGPDGDERGFSYTLRLASENEVARIEAEIARWSELTPAERTAETLAMLRSALPGLDW